MNKKHFKLLEQSIDEAILIINGRKVTGMRETVFTHREVLDVKKLYAIGKQIERIIAGEDTSLFSIEELKEMQQELIKAVGVPN